MAKRNKRLLPLLLCLACVVALFPARASAAGTVDLTRSCQLTVSYQDDGPLAGVPFTLYRVANVDETGVFRVTPDFSGYPLQFQGLTSAQWKTLAEMLRTYAQQDNIQPVTSGVTQADGKATFSGLTPGLYLAVAKNFGQGNYDYTTEPFLVALPTRDKDTDQWVYETAASAKFTRTRQPSGGGDKPSKETAERKVLKSWKGEGDHPDSVVIQLLKNGAVYDTVTLNDANNWRYTWSSLDKYADGTLIDWQVTEVALPGYTVSVSQEGVTFLVTNTKEEPDTPTDPSDPNDPDDPIIDIPDDDIPTTDLPDLPQDPSTEIPDDDTPRAPAQPDQPTSTTGKKEKLPQTGALWWPVPVLAAGGLLCLILGVVTKKGDEDA